jgi:splicing factor U2AF subunit
MAEHLASIYGTEKDKVNCSFYFKIGACRHGERCSRKHVKPNFSQTIMIANFYQNPELDPECKLDKEQLQKHFDLFYEDIYMEFCKYGQVEDIRVCNNVADHLVGNVYVRFTYEEDAQRAMEELNRRFYAGRPLFVELSPVTDFAEACCRQYENGECDRGGFCNFMHLRHPTRALKRELEEAQRLSLREKAERRGSRDRDDRDRERTRDRDRDRDRDRHGRESRRYRSRSRSRSRSPRRDDRR